MNHYSFGRVLWLVAVAFVLVASLGLAQDSTEYPTVAEPTNYLESFRPEADRAVDQTLAAYLLVLLNAISPREGVALSDVAPPEDLDRIGLSTAIYARLRERGKVRSLGQIKAKLGLEDNYYRVVPEAVVHKFRSLSASLNSDPSPAIVADLAAIASRHPDPLVRVAAAPLLLVLTDGKEEALEELRRGAQTRDRRLRLLAMTLLSRFAMEDPVLRRLTNASKEEHGRDESHETTIVVHGTFARGEAWWQNGGDFFEYLEHRVPVRDIYLGSTPFRWSGSYFPWKREEAAEGLVDWASNESHPCLNAIAHSHGSNVVLLASEKMGFGRLVLLSTPAYPRAYAPVRYGSILSLRVRLDLVLLADGGGNRFPEWPRLEERYLAWFDHSATHDGNLWDAEGVPRFLPAGEC